MNLKDEIMDDVKDIEIALVATLPDGKASKVVLDHEELFEIFETNFIAQYLDSLRKKRV